MHRGATNAEPREPARRDDHRWNGDARRCRTRSNRASGPSSLRPLIRLLRWGHGELPRSVTKLLWLSPVTSVTPVADFVALRGRRRDVARVHAAAPDERRYSARRQPPRVKSGNFTGALPDATDRSDNGPGALHAAAS